jgi:hypothetical protein
VAAEEKWARCSIDITLICCIMGLDWLIIIIFLMARFGARKDLYMSREVLNMFLNIFY